MHARAHTHKLNINKSLTTKSASGMPAYDFLSLPISISTLLSSSILNLLYTSEVHSCISRTSVIRDLRFTDALASFESVLMKRYSFKNLMLISNLLSLNVYRIRRSTSILIKIHSIDAFSRKNKNLRRKSIALPRGDINRWAIAHEMYSIV